MLNHSSSVTSNNFITGTICIFLAEALILPTGFITAVFLAHRLGPVYYGLFALLSRLITWTEWTSTSVFSDATIKLTGEAADWRPVATSVVRLQLIVSCIISVLLWFLSTPLSRIFNEPAIVNYTRLFVIDIPIFSLGCAHLSILVGKGCFKERAAISLGYWLARLLLVVLFVGMGLSIEGAILASIGASVVQLLSTWFYARTPLFSRSRFPVRKLWGFSLPLFMSALSLRVFRLDIVALKILGGSAAQAGFYGAAQNLSMPANVFTKSLSPPLLSILTRLLSEGREPKAKEIGRSAMRLVIWLLPFAAMTAGAASEIVILFFGERFSSAGPILNFLILAVVGLVIINIAKAMITAVDRPKWTFILTGPMVPLALVGHLILTVRLGGVGASLVTASVAWLGAFASIVAVYRTWDILPPLKTVFRSVICSGFAYALAILWPASALLLILKLITITLMILVGFVIFGEFTSNEMSMVRLVLRSRLNLRQNKYEV